MNYGEVLGRAWKILWKFKNLWLVWVFPYLMYAIISTIMTLLNPSTIPEIQTNSTDLFNFQPMQVGFFIFNVLILLAYMFLTVFCDTANSVAVVDAEHGAERISIPNLIKKSYSFYWRVFGFMAIFSFTVFLILLVFMGCIFGVTLITAGLAGLCLIPFMFLLIPFSMLINALVEQSKTAIIAENIGIQEGFKRGWGILKMNFWKILLMSIIINGGLFILNMVILIPIYLTIFIPMFSNLSMNNIDSFTNSAANTQIYMAYISPIYTIIGGFLYTYIRFVWTLTYLRLSQSLLPSNPSLPANA